VIFYHLKKIPLFGLRERERERERERNFSRETTIRYASLIKRRLANEFTGEHGTIKEDPYHLRDLTFHYAY